MTDLGCPAESPGLTPCWAIRLAPRIGSGPVTDVVDLQAGSDGPAAAQSVFAASCTTASRITRGAPVITVKPDSAVVEPDPAAGSVEALEVTFSAQVTGTKAPAARRVSRRGGRS